MLQVEPVKKQSISDVVFEQLRNNIVSQELAPGSKLPSEKKLSDLFGVSRTSIRAAIQRLASMGLVDTFNGDGTYVRHPDAANLINPIFNALTFQPDQILEILEFRLAIEMLGCRLAARNADEKMMTELDSIVENMQNAIKDNDAERYSIEDMRFHVCIARMSGNSLIEKVISNLSDFYMGHLLKLNQVNDLDFNISYHEGICQAIHDRNEDTAETLIKENLLRTIETVRRW